MNTTKAKKLIREFLYKHNRRTKEYADNHDTHPDYVGMGREKVWVDNGEARYGDSTTGLIGYVARRYCKKPDLFHSEKEEYKDAARTLTEQNITIPLSRTEIEPRLKKIEKVDALPHRKRQRKEAIQTMF